ncbi:hypothetical protein [Streptomyces yaizuensis]|uniref:Uncharacterized protein n=1 Tax=Streptomyces yaizuensis TaxID=2989713 RepID=A0ABQ5P607_9ACTN|nr:hypothetical protein [Streptomyces sp. YSPA8]GLF98022.1 hypothetical protein SYYSPA8_27015 [Streptomyces sp. YSPA8]
MDNMSFAALALHLSAHETGDLVTPYEVQEIRARAVERYGFEGLRAEAVKRAFFSCVEPDVYSARRDWARAAADFVEKS